MPRRKKATPYCRECPHCLGQPLAPHNPPCPQCAHCQSPREASPPTPAVTPPAPRGALRAIDLDAPVERPSYTIGGTAYAIKEPEDLSPVDWVEINRLIRETSGAFDGVDTDDDGAMTAAVEKLDRLSRRMVETVTYDAIPPDVLEGMTTRQMKDINNFFSRITLAGRATVNR